MSFLDSIRLFVAANLSVEVCSDFPSRAKAMYLVEVAYGDRCSYLLCGIVVPSHIDPRSTILPKY